MRRCYGNMTHHKSSCLTCGSCTALMKAISCSFCLPTSNNVSLSDVCENTVRLGCLKKATLASLFFPPSEHVLLTLERGCDCFIIRQSNDDDDIPDCVTRGWRNRHFPAFALVLRFVETWSFLLNQSKSTLATLSNSARSLVQHLTFI